MNTQSNKRLKDAELIIEDHVLRSQNHSIPLSHISQVWAGQLPGEQLPLNLVLLLLFLAFTGYYFLNDVITTLFLAGISILLVSRYFIQLRKIGLNFKVCTGEVYSYVSDNADFIQQAYILIHEIMAGNKKEVNYIVSFKEQGEITEILQQTTEKTPGKLVDTQELRGIVSSNSSNPQLTQELQKLYSSCKEKADIDEEILSLLKETSFLMEGNMREELKEAFRKFITLGLINNCNELGLNLLIEEIKAHIY